MKFRSALLAVLLLTLPAWGAGQLDTLRSSAKSARDQASAVRTEQMQKRQKLNQLSANIETLKAEAKGKLLPGGQLDAALKESQELSGALTSLAQTMSARESELESANLALLQALSAQLTSLRADFDRQTDRANRQKILAQFKQLRAEREQVRAALPAAKVPALEALRFSEDPTELLEQADAMRDNEDKVRRELKVLEARIAEAKSERELDGRVRQFLGEESLFDDQDRRLRVRRESPQELAAGVAPPPSLGTAADNAESRTTAGNPESPTGFNGSPAPVGAQTAGGGTNNKGTGTLPMDPPNVPAGTAPKIANGTDSRPSVGTQQIAGGDDDDLEELEVQRLKLQGLAGQLRARALDLEKKAAQLK
jgi:hypothetical protein